jgi:hypothetical protein
MNPSAHDQPFDDGSVASVFHHFEVPPPGNALYTPDETDPPSKKRKLRFEDHKQEKFDTNKVDQSIQSICQAAYRCCSFLSYA